MREVSEYLFQSKALSNRFKIMLKGNIRKMINNISLSTRSGTLHHFTVPSFKDCIQFPIAFRSHPIEHSILIYTCCEINYLILITVCHQYSQRKGPSQRLPDPMPGPARFLFAETGCFNCVISISLGSRRINGSLRVPCAIVFSVEKLSLTSYS